MNKSTKMLINGLLASTVILSQLSGTKVLAEESNENESNLNEENSTEAVLDYSIDLIDTENEEEPLIILEEDSELNELHTSEQEVELQEYEIIEEVEEEDVSEEVWEDNTDDVYWEDDASNEDDSLIESLGDIQVSSSSNEIEVNGNVTLYVDIENRQSFDTLEVSLVSETGQYSSVYLDYNRSSERFEGEFTYSTEYLSVNRDRTLHVAEIFLYDSNWTSFYLDSNHFISSVDISLVGRDYHYEKPVFDLDSLQVSSDTINNFGSLEISLDVLSDVDITHTTVSFTNDETTFIVDLDRVGNSQTFSGSYYIEPGMTHLNSTTFRLNSISSRDSYGNTTEIDAYTEGNSLPDISVDYIKESLGKLTADSSTIELFGTVDFTLELETENPLSYARVILESNSGNTESVYLDYNDQTGLYEGQFEYYPYSLNVNEDRNFTVSYIEVGDLDDNYAWLDEQIIDFSSIEIELINADINEEGPVIDLNSLTLDSNTINGFGNIQVNVDITSAIGIMDAYIIYVDEYGKEYDVWLYNDQENNQFSGNLSTAFIGEEYAEGSLTIQSIYATDYYGNRTTMRYDEYEEELSAGTIEYQGLSDFVLNLDSPTVELNDRVNITFNWEETDGLEQIELYYRSESGTGQRVVLNYDSKTGQYRGQFHYNTNYFTVNDDREFLLETISLETKNDYFYFDVNERVKEDSKISLVGSEPSYELPEIDLDTLSVNSQIIENGDLVLVNLTVSDKTIRSVDLTYSSEQGYHTRIELRRFKNTDLFVGESSLIKYNDLPVENLTLSSIEVEDIFGNVNQVSRESSGLDLGHMDLELIESQPAGTIHSDTLQLSSNTATKNDVLTYRVNIDSESKFRWVTLTLKHEEEDAYRDFEMHYDEESKSYVALVEIDDSMFDGNWEVVNIYALTSNYKYIELDNFENLSNEANILSISNNRQIPTDITLGINSVEVSKQEINSGSPFTISADLTVKSHNDILVVYAEYESEDNKHVAIELIYNPDNGLYESRINRLSSDVVDNYNLLRISYFSVIGDGYTSAENLSSNNNGAFTIIPVEEVEDLPEIDFTKVSLSDDRINVGDTLIIRVPVSSSSSIERVSMSYNNVIGFIDTLELTYNPETDQYELEIDTDDLAQGLWEFNELSIETTDGLTRDYYRYDSLEGMDNLTFLVLPTTLAGPVEEDNNEETEDSTTPSDEENGNAETENPDDPSDEEEEPEVPSDPSDDSEETVDPDVPSNPSDEEDNPIIPSEPSEETDEIEDSVTPDNPSDEQEAGELGNSTESPDGTADEVETVNPSDSSSVVEDATNQIGNDENHQENNIDDSTEDSTNESVGTEETVSNSAESTSDGNKLPKTATATWSIGFAGLLSLITGLGAAIFKRKNK